MRFMRWLLIVVLLLTCLWPAVSSPAAASPSTSPASPSSGATTIWCSPKRDISLAKVPSDVVALYHAMDVLCRGDYAHARDQFAAIVPHWRKLQGDDSYWIDSARGYFYSLIATHQGPAARAFLTGLEHDYQWETNDGDRLFWHNQPKIAFMAYAAEAGTVSGMPGDPKDKNLDDA